MFPQDFLGIAPHIDQQLFFTGGGNWQTWRKPEGKCFAWMMAIGGAGGGGGGTNASGNSGAGGGAAGLTRLFIPLWMLPDTLYIQVGSGATGGQPSGGTGGIATRSFISLQPNATAANCYLASAASAATSAAGPTPGNGESIATVANCILASEGNFLAIGGLSGAASAGSITALATIPLTPGAGGGTNSAGGNITGAGLFPTISGGSSGGTGTGGIGRPGINFFGSGRFGFMSCGGSGGGGASTGTGGIGGNGGLGSGGGGGGSGNGVGGLGAAGGKGGDGLVGIWSV